jgi:hypothetical protein
VQGDKNKWKIDRPYVCKPVIKQFGNKLHAGQIQKWLPGSKQEWELWKMNYDDGDEEDVDTHDIMVHMLVGHVTNPEVRCEADQPAPKATQPHLAPRQQGQERI